jgi:hypothetical protein
MVTGFNTDVQHDGMTLHVETEPRKGAAIETIVYTRGAVVHKFKSSYRALLNSREFSDEQLKRRIEAQHRHVIARIRAGEVRLPAPLVNPS